MRFFRSRINSPYICFQHNIIAYSLNIFFCLKSVFDIYKIKEYIIVYCVLVCLQTSFFQNIILYLNQP